MLQPSTHFETNTSRLDTLGKLTDWDKKIFSERHSLLEKYMTSSDLLPTIGAEVEVLGNRFRNNILPESKIRKVVRAGIPQDYEDSTFIYSRKTGTDLHLDYYSGQRKWEAALDKSRLATVLSREIQQLRIKKILPLNKVRYDHAVEYFPVHVTLGGVVPDFPNVTIPDDDGMSSQAAISETKYSREDWLDWRSGHPSYDDLAFQYNESLSNEVLMSSDNFLLARIMDATGWATSKERLIDAFDRSGYGHQFMRKGIAGLFGRDKESKTSNMFCVEFRTPEIWGEEGMIGLQKYMETIQKLGSMLSAYQKFPQILRDKILAYEYASKDTSQVIKLIGEYRTGLGIKSKEFELALNWISFRRDVMNLFALHKLPNPMMEYKSEEFIELANAIPDNSRVKKPESLSSMARDLVISYRSKVNNIIGDKNE